MPGQFSTVDTGSNRPAAGGKVFPHGGAFRRQVPGALNLQRRDPSGAQNDHEVALTEGSLLAKMTARRVLSVNRSQHQALQELAEPLVARTRDNLVDAMELKPEARQQLPFLLSV